jgi:flagellar biosynthetic protein FliR
MTDVASLFARIEWFVIILLRVSGFVFVSPFFGRRGVPSVAKIGLSAALALLIGSVRGADMPAVSGDPWVFAMVCVRETAMGIALGFVSSIFFSVFYTAGQIMDLQMGLSLGSMYDPEMETKTPLSGNLFYAIAFLTFVRMNGHLTLIYILFGMYDTVPPLGGSFTADIANLLVGGFTCAFLFAVKMALPMMVIMLMCEFVLGVMVKFVPQMNIFVIGLPVKILVGMAVMLLVTTSMSGLFDRMFERMYEFSCAVAQGFA